MGSKAPQPLPEGAKPGPLPPPPPPPSRPGYVKNETALKLANEIERLRVAIRKHRDSWLSGDDKCWRDNEELYQVLPEGFAIPERDTLCEMANCERYTKSCHHPGITYVSPQREIERLTPKWTTVRPTQEYGLYWVRDKNGDVYFTELIDGVMCIGDWCERSEEPGFLVAFAGPIPRPPQETK